MFRRLPPIGGDARSVAEIVNNIMDGKINSHGTVTLATGNATSTTLYDARISIDTKIVLIPFSSAAFNDTAPYGEFTNNNDQTAPSTGTTAIVQFDTTEEASGIYLSNSSRINVRNAGIYNCQYSMQLANYAVGREYADVWLRINGSDVARTGCRYDMPTRIGANNPGHVIGSMNFFLDLNAGDYVQIAGAVSSTDVTLESYPLDAGIPRPSIPAVIFTLQYVAPQAYSNIYVSAQQSGQATISHYANSTSDKTYAYILVG